MLLGDPGTCTLRRQKEYTESLAYHRLSTPCLGQLHWCGPGFGWFGERSKPAAPYERRETGRSSDERAEGAHVVGQEAGIGGAEGGSGGEAEDSEGNARRWPTPAPYTLHELHSKSESQ